MQVFQLRLYLGIFQALQATKVYVEYFQTTFSTHVLYISTACVMFYMVKPQQLSRQSVRLQSRRSWVRVPLKVRSFKLRMLRVHHYYVRMSYTCIYRLLKCVMCSFRHLIFISDETIETHYMHFRNVSVKHLKNAFYMSTKCIY